MSATEIQRAIAPDRAHRQGGTPWPAARALAGRCPPIPPTTVPLHEALGRTLASDLVAVGDLPADDNSAMDGWAVSGSPPWRVVDDLPAGQVHRARLRAGECVRIATGATAPTGAAAVLPFEESVVDAAGVRPTTVWPATWRPRTHIRRRGEEARAGDVLVAAGTVVTPPVLGLAAATGSDLIRVIPMPVVDVLVLGDELMDSGPGGAGRVRDALGPQLPGWLTAFGAQAGSAHRVPDDLRALVTALRGCTADVVVTTGGTSVGPHDHLHRALRAAGGRLVVDGVDVKPGHPMLLAALPDGRWCVGLPGNPLAACAALLTLVWPLVLALGGRGLPPPVQVRLATDQPGRPGDGHRLVPVLRGADGRAQVLPSCGSAMLRGLAGASGIAVVGPQGAYADDLVLYLPLPWS